MRRMPAQPCLLLSVERLRGYTRASLTLSHTSFPHDNKSLLGLFLSVCRIMIFPTQPNPTRERDFPCHGPQNLGNGLRQISSSGQRCPRPPKTQPSDASRRKDSPNMCSTVGRVLAISALPRAAKVLHHAPFYAFSLLGPLLVGLSCVAGPPPPNASLAFSTLFFWTDLTP